MQCPQCQAETPTDAAFCPKCGTKLALVCTQCETENSPTDNFCKKCGQNLAELDGAGPVATPKYASPETYTPKYLAERILTSKAALEGERKQVTVLFADLKGSMELLADRDPEDARALLDAVLTRMMEAVHRYEGTVNQVMGDGIMALFGAPLSLEDHALRACYAALAIQNSMRAYGEEARKKHGVEVHARVGLNSGEVVVRTIGNDLQMDYSAIGQTTHLASRMEQMAASGTVRLTGSTLRLAEGFVQVESLGPIPVKGMNETVEVFELKGATSGRTRFQATAAGGLTRFVGRTSELDDLQSALDKAGEGHGQVFATFGEAGVGKSRLYWEFIRSPRTKDWLIVESGSVSYGKATAYRPVIDLLKEYFGVEDADDHRRIREKITGKVLTLDESLTLAIPPVLSLLEVPIEDESWNNLDPPQRRQRTLDGVKRLLLREAQVQPLVVVFEDLHWIDSETQALLDSLIESLPGARVLLLVNYRPEYEHGWANKTYYTRLMLAPLTTEDAEELLQAILGEDKDLDPLKKLLIERTEGVPFYLEESVQTLVESGALAGSPGAYKLTQEISRIQVPATVQAILAARMDRLPPEEKRFLQTASVIGTHVPYPLLSAVAEMSEEELHRGLSALQTAEFLYETNLFPDREFTFKHALTHEVTYGSLVQERKRALHADIVGAIEKQAGYRRDEQIERLAHHAYEGEVWKKASEFLYQAGEKLINRSAYREALRVLEQASETFEHLPKTHKNMERAIDVGIHLRSAIVPVEWQKGIDYLRPAEILATELGDQARLGLILSYLCAHHIRTGNHTSAIETPQRTVPIVDSLGKVGLQTQTRLYYGCGCFSLGQYDRAMKILQESIDSLQGDLLYERFGTHTITSVMNRKWVGFCLTEKGDFSEALRTAEEAVLTGETVNHSYSQTTARHGLGHVHIRRGTFTQAIEVLEEGLSTVRSEGYDALLFRFLPALGFAYAMTGRTDEALPMIQEGVGRAEPRGLLGDLSLPVAWLGEANLIGGRIDAALDSASHAYDLSCTLKERGWEAWALRLLGEIHSHPNALDAELAEDHYRQALALATELGMRPLQAHSRKGLGALYGRTGQEEKARSELSTAMDMYRDMEMDFFLRQAEEDWANVG